MLSGMEKKKRSARLSTAQQDRARKYAVRHNIGLDLPPELQNALRRIAEKSTSRFLGLLLFICIEVLSITSQGMLNVLPINDSHAVPALSMCSISRKWKKSEVTRPFIWKPESNLRARPFATVERKPWG